MFAHVASYPRPRAEGYASTPVVQAGVGVQYVPQGQPGHQYARQGGVILASHGGTAAVAPLAPQARQAISEAGDGASSIVASAVAAPRGLAESTQAPATLTREQALEQRVQELELLLGQKELLIKELQASLCKAGVRAPCSGPGTPAPRRAPEKPAVRYAAAEQDDPIDVRLEEFYNATGSAIPFRRINRGFYRFGDTICELDIINHKLMARTEDGWNRGKFGPVEKFLVHYENIERQKAGILPEA